MTKQHLIRQDWLPRHIAVMHIVTDGWTIRQAETELERESRGWLEILLFWVEGGGNLQMKKCYLK